MLQMVEQNIDSKISNNSSGRSETDLPSGDEEIKAVAGRHTALQDLQNNESVTAPGTIKLSGVKRTSPERPESPFQSQSPGNNNPNGQLVYVRRKSEVELGKRIACDSANINHESQSIPNKWTVQPVSPIKPKVTCYPVPMTSSAIQSMGKSGSRFRSTESNNHPLASSGNLEVLRNLHWEARYSRLQSLLKKLDQREQENYVNLLHTLSSGELSGHAVELEKRSIQLSLEEAKELQRGEAMNILGKPLKSSVSSTPSVRLAQQQEK